MPEIQHIPDGKGGMHAVVEAAYDIVNEPWLVYELADGGRIRVRYVVEHIMRILDEDTGRQKVLEDGQPAFVTVGRALTTVFER